MKRIRLSACALGLLGLIATPASATFVDWEDGNWLHGLNNFVGYQGGQSSGSTNAGSVQVQWNNFGTSTGNHGGLGGQQPRVSAAFNGTATDGALSIGTGTDKNTAALLNYSTLTIFFAGPVNLLDFVMGDVDRLTTWQDFVAVEGRLGGAAGTLRTTNYTTSPARNVLASQFGLSGVKGSNGDVAGTSDAANIEVAFNDDVDFIRIFFFQGPDVTGNSQHGVWLRDLEYEEVAQVPEPATFGLIGLGLVAIAFIRRR